MVSPSWEMCDPFKFLYISVLYNPEYTSIKVGEKKQLASFSQINSAK